MYAVNSEQIEQYRQTLLELRDSLQEVASAASESSATVELDQSRVGRVSRMDALQSQQMALENNRRRDLQLQKIQGALTRIDNSDFGICFVCGEEINSRRLQADPTHTRCIGCANQSA